MGKLVITAEHVRQATQGGHKSIAVPKGAIITPQAKDDASRARIEFVFEDDANGKKAPAQTQQIQQQPKTTPVQTQTQNPQPKEKEETKIPTGFELANMLPQMTGFDVANSAPEKTGFEFANASAAASSFALPQVIKPAIPQSAEQKQQMGGQPTQPMLQPISHGSDAFSEVKRLVMAKMPQGTPSDKIDEMIRHAMSTHGSSDCGGGCSSCTKSAPASPIPPSSGDGTWLSRAGSSVRVDSHALPFSNNTNSVGIMQVLTPNSGSTSPSAGYAQFENGTLNWKFEQDEVLVVLEGSMQVTVDGKSYVANVGDLCAFTAGSTVSFASHGKVRFASIAPSLSK